MGNLDKYSDKALEIGMLYGSKLLFAILTLVIGLWIIRLFMKVFDKAMDRARVDLTLQRFLMNLIGVLLKAVLLISVISMIGVETTSLIAVLGAAGLAVGLALQGSLANFAGGTLILFFKPFKVGDLIEAQGYTGEVREIQIFNTILITLDNQKVVIPNGMLSNGCLKNITSEGIRRVDITFGISYGDDLLQAKKLLSKTAGEVDLVHKSPEPEVYVTAHADSAIHLQLRVWCDSVEYWRTNFALQEQVKLAFDREGITIPFPQRDVHVYQQAIEPSTTR